MSLRFADEEFQSAWRELDEAQLDGGWELFTETMGVKIYRLYDKVHAAARLLRSPRMNDFYRVFFIPESPRRSPSYNFFFQTDVTQSLLHIIN